MDGVRYFFAALLVITFPPAILYWLAVHPFIGFWRKLGAGATYAIVLSMMGITMYGLYRARDTLLGTDYGFNVPLTAVGILLYVASVVIEVRCRKHLKFSVLVGVPEIKPARGGKLLTEGIYGRMRHPRYVGVVLGYLGFALFANYAGVYLVFPVVVVGIHLVAVFEERELRARFGSEYDAYSDRVPRFVPRRA